MALTPSTMLPLGTLAPEFGLPDPSGKIVSLRDYAGAPAYLVIFMCNHCPYVKHVRPLLAELGRECQQKGVAMFGINANNVVTHPQDSPEMMAREIQDAGYVFPYLYDESQDVAKAYRAACTPDPYLFDKNRKLVYRGQLDGSRPGNDIPLTGQDIRAAIEAVLKGLPVSLDQKPSMGCNIKWKPGNEPDYA